MEQKKEQKTGPGKKSPLRPIWKWPGLERRVREGERPNPSPGPPAESR